MPQTAPVPSRTGPEAQGPPPRAAAPSWAAVTTRPASQAAQFSGETNQANTLEGVARGSPRPSGRRCHRSCRRPATPMRHPESTPRYASPRDEASVLPAHPPSPEHPVWDTAGRWLCRRAERPPQAGTRPAPGHRESQPPELRKPYVTCGHPIRGHPQRRPRRQHAAASSQGGSVSARGSSRAWAVP